MNKSEVNFTGDNFHRFRIYILPWVLKDKKYSPEHELRFLCGVVCGSEDGVMGERIEQTKSLGDIRGLLIHMIIKELSWQIFGGNCSDVYRQRIK